MTRIIALIRHGETENSYCGLFQTDNNPLTREAKIEAKKLAVEVQKWQPELIITSDMTRSKQTTQELNSVYTAQIIISPVLNEFREPTSIQGKAISPDLSYLDRVVQEYDRNPNFSLEDGESLSHFWHRIKEFGEMMKTCDKNKVLIVSHSMFIRCFAKFCETEFPSAQVFTEARKMPLGKLKAAVFELENEKWKLRSWNSNLC